MKNLGYTNVNGSHIELRTLEGKRIFLSNQEPVNYYGVYALVLHKCEFHLLEEDDSFFKTHSILTRDEIQDLKKIVDLLIEKFNFEEGCNPWDVTVKNKSTLNFKFPFVFPAEITSDNENLLVSIYLKGKILKFSPYWLGDLFRVLDIYKEPVVHFLPKETLKKIESELSYEINKRFRRKLDINGLCFPAFLKMRDVLYFQDDEENALNKFNEAIEEETKFSVSEKTVHLYGIYGDISILNIEYLTFLSGDKFYLMGDIEIFLKEYVNE